MRTPGVGAGRAKSGLGANAFGCLQVSIDTGIKGLAFARFAQCTSRAIEIVLWGRRHYSEIGSLQRNRMPLHHHFLDVSKAIHPPGFTRVGACQEGYSQSVLSVLAVLPYVGYGTTYASAAKQRNFQNLNGGIGAVAEFAITLRGGKASQDTLNKQRPVGIG